MSNLATSNAEVIRSLDYILKIGRKINLEQKSDKNLSTNQDSTTSASDRSQVKNNLPSK